MQRGHSDNRRRMLRWPKEHHLCTTTPDVYSALQKGFEELLPPGRNGNILGLQVKGLAGDRVPIAVVLTDLVEAALCTVQQGQSTY